MSKQLQPQPPYLGVAYYPEDWEEAEWDRDIQRMKEVGVTVVRIGEFAWHKMEPKPGEFDFSWMHRIVDRLGSVGIAVMLGTPTATPPRWLSRMYPDVMQLTEGGRQQHGGRRHCCSNNSHYREYSRRIVTEMAKEFGRDRSVIGWQIDNEIYEWSTGCCCPDCIGGFAEYLREKYGTIDALNRAWNLHLFSQAYDDFADVPPPIRAWVNPHHKMEWAIYKQSSHIDFVHMQAEILHRYTDAPVGTDIMPQRGMDYRQMFDKLDQIQFNHYNTPENLWHTALWMDALRPIQTRPFWNTETATCWNGGTELCQDVKPDGFCRVNSWLPLALGGEANLYWLWRTHWAGHELMHGAVLSSCGRPMHMYEEVRRTAAEFSQAADFINHTRVVSDVALHYTALNANMAAAQPILSGLQYDDMVRDTYRPLIDAGIRPDVVDARQSPDSYKLIFSPMMLTLEEGELSAHMEAWVRNGGVWVVGPMTDIRNDVGAKYTDRPYGVLENLIGVRWKYDIPDRAHTMRAYWRDGTPFAASDWYELFETDDDSLVTIAEGYSTTKGLSPLVMKRVGHGTVILVGAIPSYEDRRRILTLACRCAGIHLPEVEGSSILVIPRTGAQQSGLILVEHAGRGGTFRLDEPMTDILSGKTWMGEIPLQPYDVLVLRRA